MLQLQKGDIMPDTTDPLELGIRTLLLVVIVGIFYFVLTSKKRKNKKDGKK
jgi:preprotein translocase subunit YajC